MPSSKGSNGNGCIHPRNAAVIRQLRNEFGLDKSSFDWEQSIRQKINGSMNRLQVERIITEKLSEREGASRVVAALHSSEEVDVVAGLAGREKGTLAYAITDARSGIGFPGLRFIITKIVDW
ncbi:Uncharacterised protein [Candidatus Anstonella stagnisolia]|nr:Uncharacterised protein [Candidatus Anstonella stagnisolia]